MQPIQVYSLQYTPQRRPHKSSTRGRTALPRTPLARPLLQTCAKPQGAAKDNKQRHMSMSR